jgi:hypothetical protein
VTLDKLDRDVRVDIYRHFIATARAPTVGEVAAHLRQNEDAIRAAFVRLADAHALVLKPNSETIWMAHPFSAVATQHVVRTPDREYFANCAWDALAIPTFLGTEAESTTPCADCQEPISWKVSADGRLSGDDAVVHFSVPARQFWDDIGFT